MLQIDISWDFSHSLSGPDSSALMAATAWNICPLSQSYHGQECYYEESQTFGTVSGALSLEIPALPDAEWQLVVERDYFHKVSASVRNQGKLTEAGERRKIEIAWLTAARGHSYEVELIQVRFVGQWPQPPAVSGQCYFTFLKTKIGAGVPCRTLAL